jgi:predicted N-acetyltransferase YhbS
MIEYTEGRYAWRPVEAEGYMFIHCLMVLARHQKKGLGNLLLESCVRDAKQGKYHGVAVVTSTDSFMARSDVFLKGGFVPVDRITPYELLVKKFGKNAANPRFLVEKGRLVERYGRGLTILAADQCPYVVKSVERIAAACKKLGIEPNVVRVESAEASRMLPTPYGVFCILHDGSVIAKRPISGTRFLSIMGGVVGKR